MCRSNAIVGHQMCIRALFFCRCQWLMDLGKCFASSPCFGFRTFFGLKRPMGEDVYVLDLSSLQVCGYQPHHVMVIGRFQEKSPLPGWNGRLTYEVDLCPRTILH